MKKSNGNTTIKVNDIELQLLPQKAIYRPDCKELILSDLHIGKAAHFRKNGIPIPGIVNKNNFWLLSGLLENFRPEKVFFLGDLSHSIHNKEWDDFADFLRIYPNTQFHLIRGNHDLMTEKQYESAGLICSQTHISNNILYVHEYQNQNHIFTLSGHLHPAVRLSGNAKQSLRMPCFWLRKNDLILPAFGDFTGKLTVKPEKEDRIFVITPEEVIEVKS